MKKISLLIEKDVNLMRGIFLLGEISKFLSTGGILLKSLGFSPRVCRKGGSPYMVGEEKQN